MRPVRLAGFALVLAALASCAPRPAPPAPPPPPPAPPPPAPAPPPPAVGWEDAPASLGDWRYRQDGAGSAAFFGTAQDPQFVVSCANRQVSLSRRGVAGGSALVVRTTFGDRSLPGTARDGGVTASLAASDPLLDWMVFSRGRFAVEAEGTPRLVIPAWPEPARVIEDCRG